MYTRPLCQLLESLQSNTRVGYLNLQCNTKVSYLRVCNLIPESTIQHQSQVLDPGLQVHISVYSAFTMVNAVYRYICVRNSTVLSFNDDLPVSGTLRYQDPIFVQSNVGFYNVLCSIYVLVHLITITAKIQRPFQEYHVQNSI